MEAGRRGAPDGLGRRRAAGAPGAHPDGERAPRGCGPYRATSRIRSTTPSRSLRASFRSSAWMSPRCVSASHPARRPSSATSASHAADRRERAAAPRDRHAQAPGGARRIARGGEAGRHRGRGRHPGTACRRIGDRRRPRRDRPDRRTGVASTPRSIRPNWACDIPAARAASRWASPALVRATRISSPSCTRQPSCEALAVGRGAMSFGMTPW